MATNEKYWNTALIVSGIIAIIILAHEGYHRWTGDSEIEISTEDLAEIENSIIELKENMEKITKTTGDEVALIFYFEGEADIFYSLDTVNRMNRKEHFATYKKEIYQKARYAKGELTKVLEKINWRNSNRIYIRIATGLDPRISDPLVEEIERLQLKDYHIFLEEELK